MDRALRVALTAIDESAGNEHLIAAKCRGLMRGYHERWINSQSAFRVIGVEEMIKSDLWNLETGRKSRTFSLAGKIDVRAERDGRQVIIDHKTCSEDITDPNAAYWRQLIIEAQPTHYMLLEHLNGRRIDEAIWDVVRKPTISPKKLSAADCKAAIMTRRYFDCQLSDDDVLALQAEPRESFAMYEARLAHDCTVERPEWYFGRRTIVRLDNELIEYANELWDHGQEILHVRNTDRHSRNSGACMNYGRPCKFLGICSGYDTPDSDKWYRRESVHPELDGIGESRGMLTNTRIRCFQTCRKKHYYDYELGIERFETEDIDARYFGTVLHKGLEAWWLSFKEVADGNEYDNGSTDSEFATADATE